MPRWHAWPLFLCTIFAVAFSSASLCPAGSCARDNTQRGAAAGDPETTSLLQVSRVEQLRSAAAASQAGQSEDLARHVGPSLLREMLSSDPLQYLGQGTPQSPAHRDDYVPGERNAQALWQLAGKWENISPMSGFCLVSLPYQRKDQLQLGQGITFNEQFSLQTVRQSVRDRTYAGDADILKELWLEGVYYLKLINTSRFKATSGNAIYVREEYLDADPNASRDNPVEPDPLLHVETGQWLSMATEENITAPRFTVTRLASIPHGTSLVASGNFASIDCGFATEHCMDGEYERLAQQYSSAPLNFDCDAAALSRYWEGMDQKYGSEYARSPVAFLVNATRGLRIRSFVRWEVSTLAQESGEGLVNLPFLERQVRPSAFNSTLYLLSVDANDGSTFDVIQYIEGLHFEADLGCDGTRGKFPHLNLNTLKRMNPSS